MAGRWSCEHCVLEFKELQASALAVDCIGKWALLAGRKNLAFVDLDQSKQTVMKVTRQSKWDIGCVQWNRHASHAHRFVTACNQRLDVFDFREGSAHHLCSLKAHTRNVSDIDWSPFDVNIVASCSVDTFTYLWDVRDAKKPIKLFQTVSGAYQVKWNKVTNNLFATTHDGDIRIWDPRKGNSPVHYISAHPSKIHGLDWSHSDQYKLVTASQDCTIRFWDYTNPRRSEAMISSGSPVWRARFTPFGFGVMSVVLPQLRRGENSIYLWNKESESPIHTFVGHKDVILEFQWRKQMEGSSDHHLVTWSRDQSLRIWKVDTTLQKLCGHDVEESSQTEEDLTLPAAITKSFQEPTEPVDFFLEPMPKPAKATPTASTPYHTPHPPTGPHGFPPHQQQSVPRVASHSSSASNTNGATTPTAHVSSLFNATAIPSVNGSTFAESSSLASIPKAPPTSGGGSVGSKLAEQDETASAPDRKYTVEKVKVPTQIMYPTESYQDSQIPFPRTCGARFCSNDFLVVFNVPSTMKKVYDDGKSTPRALSELVSFTSQPQWIRPASNGLFPSAYFYGSSPQHAGEGVTISDWFTEKQPKHRHHHHHRHHGHRSHHQGRQREFGESGKHREKDKETDKQSRRLQKVAAIKIYNIATINPVNKYLAEHYKIDQDEVSACCEHNAKVANEVGRNDLVQLWTTICHMSHPKLKPSPSVDQGRPWAMHPFGAKLVDKFLSHYSGHYDVQTLAMICCMFWDKETNPTALPTPVATTYQPPTDSSPSFEYAVTTPYNPYHTVSSMTNLLKGWTTMKASKGKSEDTGATTAGATTAAAAVAASTTVSPLVDGGTAAMTQHLQNPSTSNGRTAKRASFSHLPPISSRPPHHVYYHHYQPPPTSPLASSLSSSSTHPHSTSSSSSSSYPSSSTIKDSSSSSSFREELIHFLRLSSPSHQPNTTHRRPSPPPPPPPPPPSPPPFSPSPLLPHSSVAGGPAGFLRSNKGQGQGLLANVASQPNLALLFRSVMKGKRSMSWSESVDITEKDPQRKEMEAERILHQNKCKMLNPANRNQHEQIKQAYANILYNWQLLNQRTQVLKHTVSNQTNCESEFRIFCSKCSKPTTSFKCDQCSCLALNCSICHVGVRGTANVCVVCGHGGHSSHMLDWFSTFDVCPSGCGCHCVEENKAKNFL